MRSVTSAGASAKAEGGKEPVCLQKFFERDDPFEHRLRTELLRAEKQLNQATPENHEKAFQRYREALAGFSDLVLRRPLLEETDSTEGHFGRKTSCRSGA